MLEFIGEKNDLEMTLAGFFIFLMVGKQNI